MKRIVCMLLCLLMLLSIASCNTEDDPAVSDTGGSEITGSKAPVTQITPLRPRPTAEITDGIFYMFEGDTRRLNYSIHTPEGAEGKVAWISSSDCVIVENGVVYAKNEGYAIVSGGGERDCIVRVLPRMLPVLDIDTDHIAITSKEEYVPCLIDLSSSVGAYCFEDVSGGIRLRGNSTSSRPKKPYRIKFDSKRNLLGMNEGAECKSWVLLAEWFDSSMLHNSTSLSLASVILTEYTSDWRYVNVYLNGEYQGVYLLAEQSQINKYRVNIEEAGEDSSSIRSGYLFEQENSSKDPILTLKCSEYSFTNFLGEKYTGVTQKYELKNDGTSAEQDAFAEKYLKNVFHIIYMATYENFYMAIDEDGNLVRSTAKTAEEAIRAVIDVDSLARKYIHSELTCNWDDRQKSYYMHVDFSEGGTGLLTFSCPWDFDHAFYQYGTFKYADTEAYFAARRNMWYVMLLNHDFVRERIAEVWQEVYADTAGFDSVLDMMLTITRNYETDFRVDADMWERGSDGRPAGVADRLTQVASSYQWLIKRITWLNEQFTDPNFAK